MASKSLLTKPRIQWPIVKIGFEIYHALRPFHHLNDSLSSKRSLVFLFFIFFRWSFFLRRLIGNKAALNRAMSFKEKAMLSIAICGHILMIWAQDATLKYERERMDVVKLKVRKQRKRKKHQHTVKVNDRGPYSIVRHPQHIGKWMSEAFVALYQSNRMSMVLSVATLGLTVSRANREEKRYRKDKAHSRYKRKVPNKLVPGIY